MKQVQRKAIRRIKELETNHYKGSLNNIGTFKLNKNHGGDKVAFVLLESNI